MLLVMGVERRDTIGMRVENCGTVEIKARVVMGTIMETVELEETVDDKIMGTNVWKLELLREECMHSGTREDKIRTSLLVRSSSIIVMLPYYLILVPIRVLCPLSLHPYLRNPRWP